jgi:hypothetical protein
MFDLWDRPRLGVDCLTVFSITISAQHYNLDSCSILWITRNVHMKYEGNFPFNSIGN